jgi:hypothetical protein
MTDDYITLLKESINTANVGDIRATLLYLQQALNKLGEQVEAGGIPSVPPDGCQQVTNLYVENGKLVVEYET